MLLLKIVARLLQKIITNIFNIIIKIVGRAVDCKRKSQIKKSNVMGSIRFLCKM